ncbi:MAG: histidine kinase dimerization/phospho-acceptor domain-containing protein, partial [Terriglobales bacterium]
MRILANPIVVTMVLLFLAGALAVLVGIWLVRRMRRNLDVTQGWQAPRSASVDSEGFAAAAFQGVIQRLKEQEKELNRLRQRERERAEASENISSAVLSNLTSGVVLFNPAGMVRQANQAARDILGYASPTGLHARQLFQGASAVRHETGESAASAAALLEAVELSLREARTFRRLEVEYSTPAGARRVLGVTLSPVHAGSGEALGTACLVSDLTEITDLARRMRLQENLASLGEMSAGIAHEFKNSLATISGYAQMLGSENPPETIQEFSGKIVAETNQLTRIVTDFLNFARPLGLAPEP